METDNSLAMTAELNQLVVYINQTVLKYDTRVRSTQEETNRISDLWMRIRNIIYRLFMSFV